MSKSSKTYNDKIVECFKFCCQQNLEKDGEAGASPSDVTNEMHKRGWLSDYDTVLDIEKLMRGLRNRGLL